MAVKRDPMVYWTDSTRVQLVEAVIQVEEEILTAVKKSLRGSPSDTQSGKWERVSKLLPAELQKKTWSRRHKNKIYYKCERQFHEILHAYRYTFQDIQVNPERKTGRSRCLISSLTDPVLAVMKKREDRLKAHISTPVENGSNSGSKAVSSTTTSAEGHEQLSPSSDRELLARKQHRDTGTERGAAAISEEYSRHDTLLVDKQGGKEIERAHMEYENSVCHRSNAAQSLGLVSKNDAVQNMSARPIPGSVSRSLSDQSNGPGIVAEARHQVQAQAQAPRLEGDSSSSTRRPSNHSRTARSKRGSTASVKPTRDDEHLHASLNGQLRTVDLELSRLSSWLHNRFNPTLRKDAHLRLSSSIASWKRHKVNAGTVSTPLDDLMLERLKRTIDLQIQASFQKAKVRLAEDFRKASVEVVELVREETHSVYRSPDASTIVRTDKSPSRRPMSPHGDEIRKSVMPWRPGRL